MNNTPVKSLPVAELPKYDEVPVLGVTTRLVSGTAPRNTVSGRLILTEEPGYGIGENLKTRIVAESERRDRKTRIVWSAVAVDTVHFWVRTATGLKSFDDGFVAERVHVAMDKDNPEIRTVFVREDAASVLDAVSRAAACAERMCEAHPEACGYWEFVDAFGKRLFFRVYAPVAADGSAVMRVSDENEGGSLPLDD